ncbi:MAG: dicarboxylate/amino acid:cation symporter, partial [Candidatus Omnitrophica bacterium]|nr:dicarboxylate/amino acid:cation symporter [Candidatus Omnitrophota bacterium]
MIVSLNTQIFAGALLGAVFGLVLGHTGLSPAASPLLSGLDLLGKIFIGLLKLLMVPLVFTSIAAGIANLKHSGRSRRVWPALILYSLTTTSLAAATGLTTMNLIKPGEGLDIHLFKASAPHAGTAQPLSADNIFVIIVLAALTGIILIVLG